MLKAADNGEIDIILTKSIQRFARNTVDLLNTVRHLKDIGVAVWFEKEHIDSMSGDGELMLTILASFAQEESRKISERVKWGIRRKMEEGWVMAIALCSVTGLVTVNLRSYRKKQKLCSGFTGATWTANRNWI